MTTKNEKILFINFITQHFFFSRYQIFWNDFRSETKEPIIDANIVFIGSDFGSASDLNGNFSVTNLQKQEYEILISAIGYKDIIASVNLLIRIAMFLN